MVSATTGRLLAGLAIAVAALVLAVPRPAAAEGPPTFKADRVLVLKAERRLKLLRGGDVLREFPISLGWNPVGHKLHEGDGRTPEGRYVLDYFNRDSQYYLSIRISYPNGVDLLRAARRGDRVGGNIVIHGLPPQAAWIGEFQSGTDWTSGCIAVSNEAMDVIWVAVDPGTPIDIRP